MKHLGLLLIAACSHQTSNPPDPVLLKAAALDRSIDPWPPSESYPAPGNCRVVWTNPNSISKSPSWVQRCSVSNPQGFGISWDVPDDDAPIALTVSIAADLDAGMVHPGLLIHPAKVGEMHADMPFGVYVFDDVVYLWRWRPPREWVGLKLFVQLHAPEGRSDILQFEVVR